MIIPNILTTSTFSQYGTTLDKLCKRIKQNVEDLIDITTEPFGRGTHLVSAHGQTYLKKEFDQVVKGHTVKLYQTSTQDLLVVNVEDQTPEAYIITKESCSDDREHVNGYTFKPFTDFKNTFTSKVVKKLLSLTGNYYIIEKVVGTSFRKQPDFSQFDGQETDVNNIPVKKMKALLLPEPDNQYDPNAVKVIVPLTSGKAHHLGYLGKSSELYKIIKQPTAVELAVLNYPAVGDYNMSYELRYEQKG